MEVKVRKLIPNSTFEHFFLGVHESYFNNIIMEYIILLSFVL